MVALCSTHPVQLYMVHIARRLLFRKSKAALSLSPSHPHPNPILSSLLSSQPELGLGGCLGLAIEREQHGRDSGEIRRLLNSLECKQDEYAKSMILHSITRCVYLLEAEVRDGKQEVPASLAPGGYKGSPPLWPESVLVPISLSDGGRDGNDTRGLGDMGGSGPRTPPSPASCVSPGTLQASACTTDDIGLVGSMLDDKDNSVKIQALNALKALSGIRKFRLKIQVSPGTNGAAEHTGCPESTGPLIGSMVMFRKFKSESTRKMFFFGNKWRNGDSSRVIKNLRVKLN